ncbi:MAG: hypothetical protein QOK08_2110 [Actinomycetota bacterium]|jgi:hypothetical protein|nr:hypothetical protein [Actinomycetota bacterium]
MTESQPVVLGAPPRYGPPSRDRRPLPAFVTAAGIVVAFLVLQFLMVAVAGVYNWAASRFSEAIVEILASSATALRGDVVPMAVILVVSFLIFWGIAPIHSALRLGQALGRGIWAAVVSGVITGIALVIQYLAVLNGPPLSAYGTPSLHDILRGAAEASVQGVTSFAQTAAYIVLGAVILWSWMRVHPRSASSVDAGLGSSTDAPTTV